MTTLLRPAKDSLSTSSNPPPGTLSSTSKPQIVKLQGPGSSGSMKFFHPVLKGITADEITGIPPNLWCFGKRRDDLGDYCDVVEEMLRR